MIYIVYILLLFAFYQMIISLTNVIFNQPLDSQYEDIESFISILIPARNEENNLGHLLTDLLEQDYQNIEIIIFDDQSIDSTLLIAETFCEKDSRISIIRSEGLPQGWLGKNYACYSLANSARGDYFLFLDSDVRIKRGIIGETVAWSKKHNIGLLSVFPKQEMITTGELFTVPLMHYILLSLLPLILVRKSKFSSLSAANGQFMLFDALLYNTLNPHKLTRSLRAEDIEISRIYKDNNIPVVCLTGINSVSCRMYGSFCEAVNGFSKNIIMFFGNSFLLAVLFWLITSFGFLIVLMFSSIQLFLVYLAILLMTKIFTSIASKQNAFLNIVYFIPQHISMGLILLTSLIRTSKKRHSWKGRNI